MSCIVLKPWTMSFNLYHFCNFPLAWNTTCPEGSIRLFTQPLWYSKLFSDIFLNCPYFLVHIFQFFPVRRNSLWFFYILFQAFQLLLHRLLCLGFWFWTLSNEHCREVPFANFFADEASFYVRVIYFLSLLLHNKWCLHLIIGCGTK